jgi:peptidoglycan/LPS O-acetylase OafA/YrhL
LEDLSEHVPAIAPRLAQGLWKPRYSMIDAWRGIAALGVVFYHLGLNRLGFGMSFDLGHASVMVFFVISGYCITASADSCKRNNVGPAGYMWRRVRRIYPPYFFSICFFLATRLVKIWSGWGDDLRRPVLVWVQNLTMTQWFTLVRHPLAYAYGNPALLLTGYWSLDYEEQFYLVMGLILFCAIYFRKGMVLGVVSLMIPALIWNVTHPALFYGFFLEYWIAFAMGSIVFYRLCKAESFGARACVDVTLILFLILAVCRGGISGGNGPWLVYSEWIVTSVFALILIYVRPWDIKFKESTLGLVLGGLGLISYSLYLTHQCVLHASSAVASRLILLGLPRMLEIPIRTAVLCAVAAIFWYFCERPFLNTSVPNQSAAGARPRNGPDQ